MGCGWRPVARPTYAARDAPSQLRCSSLPEVALLQRFWEQEYTCVAKEGRYELRDPKAVPAATEHLESPYEPEARFATKRGMHWTGYKVHVTETCDDERPTW